MWEILSLVIAIAGCAIFALLREFSANASESCQPYNGSFETDGATKHEEDSK